MGLLGLVAIKVLAPGYYASQDIRTPVKIAVVVLLFTQALNVLLVPLLQHAGLALSIGLAALVNALWLLVGLLRRGVIGLSRVGRALHLQVVCCKRFAGAVAAGRSAKPGLVGAAGIKYATDSLAGWRAARRSRVVLGALWAAGLNLRQLLRRWGRKRAQGLLRLDAQHWARCVHQDVLCHAAQQQRLRPSACAGQ